MKEQDIHSVLWQKRNELTITDDVQHDWLDMQAMLDMQMPVGNLPAGNGGLSGFSGLKLLSVLLATLGAATLIYFAIQKNKSKYVNPKKNTTTIAIANKNVQSADSINASQTDNLSHTDSLSMATSSAQLNATTPGSANTEKSKAGAGMSSSSNTTTGNTVNNSATPDSNSATTGRSKSTNNTLPGNKAIVGANNHTVKGSSTVIANNKTNNGAHLITRSGSSPLNHNPNNGVKTTGRVNHLPKPGAGAVILHSSHIGNRVVGGSSLGLARYGHNHRLRTVNGLSNNAISKSRSGHSSRKGKNNSLNGNAKPGRNRRDQYTGANKNPVADTSLIPKNSTDQNADLADAVQASIVPETYVPVDISPVLANKFKDAQNGNPSIKNPGGKTINSKNPKLDWGILAGVNTAGSFTAKSQNANFYGSFPVDMFFGLFATYHFSDSWGFNLGIRGLNPQTLSGSYTHANESKIDTLQILNISDSRKVYFVDVPLNLVFKPNQYLSLKAGPVFSIPIKQVNGISTFQTGKLKKDSLYYVKVTQAINATNYTQSVNVNLSLGASAETGRFIFDAAYIRGLKGLTVGSSLGSYTANSNEFLFTVGFKLNKPKK